ncbi:glycolate oxidase subunit GlcE [Thalassobius vesicularis]|uniref:Glycolate oxidase subunit GlcE n=1 Tax=Thalassobius vesicularis TaxID=1294297 RepID=A0A4S3MBX6_9RHOB|nr:glycolate oxidase subunit GlcE [Thalassobius vesicularis]THD74046.1 glycolate oxidase subunit GlcE [Thalassobius vesicularis]
MKPQTEAELAEMVAGTNGPLRVRGGGTRPIGAPMAGEVLDMSGMSGVVLHEPGALTLVVKAGTPVAEVERVLAAEGQRLPFEPMDHRALLGSDGEPTMGGVVAANVSGPRRVQVGACRDFLLGVRFVDGTGRVLKNGGRVMKNVTGYDLVKLMAGSWGTLGVMTELSFKVLAVPQAEATLVKRGASAAEGVALLSEALGAPYDVSGAAHLEGRTQVRLEGLAGSVAYRVDQLRKGCLAGFDVVEGAESQALWQEVRDVTPFAEAEGDVWRVSVKPSDGPKLSEALDAAGVRHRAIYDWGGGLVWLLVQPGDATAIRPALAAFGGHATLIRGRAQAGVPVFQPELAPVAAISSGLRAKFDPRGIFNPGLMG